MRYLYLCCYLAVLTPFVTVTLSYSSQRSLIFLVQLPTLSYALFCTSEVPHLLSHTHELWPSGQEPGLPVSQRLNPAADFPAQLPEQTEFHGFLEILRLNSLRWSHRKLQQLWEPSSSYLHLSCMILKGVQGNRLNSSGKSQDPEISKILQCQIPLLQQLFFYTHKALKSVSPY